MPSSKTSEGGGTTTVKARYLGPVLLNGPGDRDALKTAVERLRSSAQVARASVHISRASVKITDRAGKDVLLLAERDNICCHGMPPGFTTFLGVVVNQGSRYYCHVINMPKGEANKANKALVGCFGGGDCDVVPNWKNKNKRRFRQSVKKQARRPSIAAAPSNGFDPHVKKSLPPPRTVVQSPEQLAKDRASFPRKFVGMYLGAQPVDALFGADVIRRAVEANGQERLRQHMADTTTGFGDPVTVIISTENVRTMDRTTGSVMMSEFIKNISYTSVLDSVDGNDVFAFIAVNKRIGGIHCHIYHVPRGQGQMAYLAVETAFKLLAADEKERGDNPFAVTDPRREPAPDILFRHQIHRADLKALQQIGAGQFGAVYTAYQYTRPKPGAPIEKMKRAVKLLRNAASDQDKREFTQEAETMLDLHHKNLVRMIGVAIQQKPWLCVLEFMDYGDLKSLVSSCRDKNIPLYDGEFYYIGKQLAAGCAYLSAKRLVHMDLAARNALVTRNNVVKVADFGLTRSMDPGKDHLILRETMRLALKWISPEGMEHKRFSEASDVWSFGVTMWEVLTYGASPYGRIKTADIQRKIKEGTRLPRPPMCTDALAEILDRCWRHDPQQRPAFKDLELEFSALHEANAPPERDIGALLSSRKAGRGAVRAMPKSQSQSNLGSMSDEAAPRKARSSSHIGFSTAPQGVLASVTGQEQPFAKKTKKGKGGKARKGSSSAVQSIMDQMAKAYGTAGIDEKPEGANLPETYFEVDHAEPVGGFGAALEAFKSKENGGTAADAQESYFEADKIEERPAVPAAVLPSQMKEAAEAAEAAEKNHADAREKGGEEKQQTKAASAEAEDDDEFGFGDLAG